MRVVFLSGPGGVGKTRVGRHAQRLLSDGWLYFEVDRCQPLVPPNPGFATVENDRRLTRATLQAARSYVTAGFPTLVEMDVVAGNLPRDVRRGRIRTQSGMTSLGGHPGSSRVLGVDRLICFWPRARAWAMNALASSPVFAGETTLAG